MGAERSNRAANLVVRFTREGDRSDRTEAYFTDPRLAIEAMLRFVEGSGSGSNAMLLERQRSTDIFVANIYWNGERVIATGRYITTGNEQPWGQQPAVALAGIREILARYPDELPEYPRARGPRVFVFRLPVLSQVKVAVRIGRDRKQSRQLK
jgi:hypothetical protein